MTFDREHVTDLNTALDEATVRRIGWDEATARVQVRLCVRSVDERDRPDPDPVRVLTFTQVRELRILLRPECFGVHHGRTIPLAGEAALGTFLDSLALTGPMHGGRAVDDASPTDDWPATASLTVRFDPPPTAGPMHCFYWFTECARQEPGGLVGYLLEGLVRFTGLEVHRADGTPLSVPDVAAAGLRWRRLTAPGVLARTPP